MTIIYDIEKEKVIGRFTPQYLVNGKPQDVDPPLYELDLIQQERPEINPETQRLKRLDPVIDLNEKTYTEDWQVIDLTPYEIAMKDWEGGDLQIKIVAPIQLILDDFGVKMKGWFELRGLPVIAKGEFVHLYCNELQPQFTDIVDNLASQGIIEIIERPKP